MCALIPLNSENNVDAYTNSIFNDPSNKSIGTGTANITGYEKLYRNQFTMPNQNSAKFHNTYDDK